MPVIGKDSRLTSARRTRLQIQEVEQEIHEIREAALEAGKSTEALNESGQWTAMQRIDGAGGRGDLVPAQQPLQPAGQR